MDPNDLGGIVWGVLPIVRKSTIEEIVSEFEEPEISEKEKREFEAENSDIASNLRYLAQHSVSEEERKFAERLALIVYFAIKREYEDRQPGRRMQFATHLLIRDKVLPELLGNDANLGDGKTAILKRKGGINNSGAAYEDGVVLKSPEKAIQAMILDRQYELHDYLIARTNFARGKFGNNLAVTVPCLVYLSLKEAEKTAASSRLEMLYATRTAPAALSR